MKSTINKYLTKRSVHHNWALTGTIDRPKVTQVAVIPALAELEHLFDVLDALCLSSSSVLAHTLLICVINNSEDRAGSGALFENNQHTLAALHKHSEEGRYSPMMVAWVDASSAGHALPAGQGVGLARKIGLDHGLALLNDTGCSAHPLICLDADAPPAPGYLDALHAFYREEERWAGYAAYEHRFSESPDKRAAMIAYEIYMRYHELGLRYAGSPYAYPALGSIISCTAEAYAASGGMNRRLAGEDFYFMQELTKTGTMTPVPYALVYPSGRISQRTPFGTGQSVNTHETTGGRNLLLYHPRCYEVLQSFFRLAQTGVGLTGKEMLERTRHLHPSLAAFLEGHNFCDIWEMLCRQHADPERRTRQFHVWFDGLKTIQFIHYFRDNVFPYIPVHDALGGLFELKRQCEGGGIEDWSCLQELDLNSLLTILRRCALKRHAFGTGPVPDYSPEAFLRLAETN